jgi:hypothetical protein
MHVDSSGRLGDTSLLEYLDDRAWQILCGSRHRCNRKYKEIEDYS